MSIYNRFPITACFLTRFDYEMEKEKFNPSGHPIPEHRASQLAADQTAIVKMQLEAGNHFKTKS